MPCPPTHPTPSSDGATLQQWFLSQYAHCDAAGRKSAIRCAVACGYGSWPSPLSADRAGMPITRRHQVTVFGLTTCAADADQAVALWFKHAAKVFGQEPAIEPSPEIQLKARRFALVEIVNRVFFPQVSA